MIKETEILKLLKEKLSIEKADKIEKMFSIIDRNHDNFIDQDEFIRLIKIIDENIEISDILSLYNSIDFNKDGRISFLEFFKCLDVEEKEIKKLKLETKVHEEGYNQQEKRSFQLIVENILRFLLEKTIFLLILNVISGNYQFFCENYRFFAIFLEIFLFFSYFSVKIPIFSGFPLKKKLISSDISSQKTVKWIDI